MPWGLVETWTLLCALGSVWTKEKWFKVNLIDESKFHLFGSDLFGIKLNPTFVKIGEMWRRRFWGCFLEQELGLLYGLYFVF